MTPKPGIVVSPERWYQPIPPIAYTANFRATAEWTIGLKVHACMLQVFAVHAEIPGEVNSSADNKMADIIDEGTQVSLRGANTTTHIEAPFAVILGMRCGPCLMPEESDIQVWMEEPKLFGWTAEYDVSGRLPCWRFVSSNSSKIIRSL